LPCAEKATHGKAHVCRVPGFLTHGKGDTHGKRARMPCATVVTHGKHEAHGNFLLKNLIPPLQLLWVTCYCMWHFKLDFGIFLDPFAIFNFFISMK